MAHRLIQFTWTEEQAETCYAALRVFQLIANHADRHALLAAVEDGGRGQGISEASVKHALIELQARMAFLVMDDARQSARVTHLERLLDDLARWIREGEGT